jgi:hypothetical protein
MVYLWVTLSPRILFCKNKILKIPVPKPDPKLNPIPVWFLLIGTGTNGSKL